MDDRQAYYWRRAREARELAAAATDDRARLAHTVMSARYEQLAGGEGAGASDASPLAESGE